MKKNVLRFSTFGSDTFLKSGILALIVLSMSGCSANFGSSSDTPTLTSFNIKGITHGGQQPLYGAHVHMFAAGTSGYASSATDVLTAGGLPVDSYGHYATTDASGNFSLAGAVNCTETIPNDQLLYLYSTGGDPQPAVDSTPVSNTAAGLLAVVGACSNLNNVSFVFMNEVTTIATAYALAGFATSGAHIGAPSAVVGHALSGTGITNAFNTALNIIGQTTGRPLPATPAGNGTIPVAEINTLADILAACINSSDPGSSGCTTLFGDTNTSTSGDTATAAINIAHNPTTQISSLLTLVNNASPFQPFLTSANDFTLAVTYTGGGLNEPIGYAIDSSGSIWAANYGGASLSKFSPLGAALSPSTGYTGGGLIQPYKLAIDDSGNVWAANYSGGGLSEFSPSGTAIFSYAGGGLGVPDGVAIDALGNIWSSDLFSNSLSKLNSSGIILSDPTGYTGGGLDQPVGVAIDGSGDVWTANSNSSTLSEFSSSGTALSSSAGYTGGGLSVPYGITIDGSGNVWTANSSGSSLSEFSSLGIAISPATGYTSSGQLGSPYGVAVDSSGNVWTGNLFSNSLGELIGAATPVVTPQTANLSIGTRQPAQKP